MFNLAMYIGVPEGIFLVVIRIIIYSRYGYFLTGYTFFGIYALLYGTAISLIHVIVFVILNKKDKNSNLAHGINYYGGNPMSV